MSNHPPWALTASTANTWTPSGHAPEATEVDRATSDLEVTGDRRHGQGPEPRIDLIGDSGASSAPVAEVPLGHSRHVQPFGPEDQRALDALRVVLRSSQAIGGDGVPALVDAAGRALGATRALAWLVDYDQVTLAALGGSKARAAPMLAVSSTAAGDAYRGLVVRRVMGDREQTVWVPLVSDTVRLGVLELVFAVSPAAGYADDASCRDLAAALGALIVAKSRYGDAIERVRRRKPLTVSAEIGWPLMPPLSCVTKDVRIAAAMAPATKIAGDAFDYAIDGTTVHLALLDAMGHSLQATLMAAVATGALRNARLSGKSLSEIVRDVDASLASQFGGDNFVTGIVGQLDLRSGIWTWVNCGHPPALVVSDGHMVKTLDSVGAAPLGLGLLATDFDTGAEQLRAGDMMLLYTDGITEARDRFGRQFGIGRLARLAGSEALSQGHLAEALRHLNVSLLAHQDWVTHDAATTVLVEWRGPAT